MEEHHVRVCGCVGMSVVGECVQLCGMAMSHGVSVHFVCVAAWWCGVSAVCVCVSGLCV